MRIVKKQQGGFVYAQYKPLATPIGALGWGAAGLTQLAKQAQSTSSATSSTSKSEGDVGLLTKDMVKLLYENGLPNDVDQFIKNVDIFGESVGGNPFVANTSSSQEAQYKQILSILPKLKLNKEQYDKALENAQKNDTIKETAISLDGRVFTYNENGGIAKKHISELDKNERALTVGELAQIRAYAPQASFDNGEIAQTINNSISIESVFKTIQQIVDKLGKDTVSSDRYIKKDSSEEKAQEGIKQLLQEASDGIYKQHVKETSQKDKAKYALKYILETLPKNAEVLLQDYARRRGYDLRQGPYQIIQDFITGQLDYTLEKTIDYQKNESEASGLTSSGVSGENLKNAQQLNQAMAVASGDFLQQEYQYITPGNNSYAYQVKAQILPFIKKAGGGGNIGEGKLSALLSYSEIGGILDKNSVHAGNQLINPVQFGRIYYTGSGGQAMDLPYKVDANGKVMPDWDLMEVFAKAQTEAAALKNPTTQEINKIFAKYGLTDYFTANGKPNRSKYRRFFAVEAIGDESSFKDADDNAQYFTEIDDDSIEEMISVALGTQKNPLKLEGDIYKTILYIPVYDSPTNAMMAGRTDLKIPLKSAAQYGREEAEMYDQQKQHNQQITKSMI